MKLLGPTSEFDRPGCGCFNQRAPKHGRVEARAGRRRDERIGGQTAFAGFSRAESERDQQRAHLAYGRVRVEQRLQVGARRPVTRRPV